MGVQGHEFPKLPIDNPPSGTVCVFALDPEDGLVPIERVQAIADPDTKSMEENGYTAMTFLISFEPEFEHERCEVASDEFVGDIYALLSESTGTSCLGSLRVTVSDHGGK